MKDPEFKQACEAIAADRDSGACQLADWQVPVTLITDAQMGLFVERADAVLVGGDSLLTDGAVVNKAGTRLLALAAREQGIPPAGGL